MKHVWLRGHCLGEASCEFLDLSPKVKKEGVAFPATKEHDGCGPNLGHVKEHGAACAY
jgi:hypothetical protein